MLFHWGILGVARINHAVIPPIHESERHTLLAVASRDKGRAERAAKDWSIPRAYGSYDKLLADAEIDAVYIPLPNALHETWTIASLRAGKHVLCEKPLALTPASVDRIAVEAKAAQRITAEAFMYRHHLQTIRVKELIDGGALGRVRLVRGVFTFTLDRETDVRLNPDLGGGSLWDVGCYPVSFARAALGEEPVEVFGWAEQGGTGVDEAFAGQLRFPSGAFAQLDCGFRSPYRTEIEIVGSEGTLRVPRPFKPGLHETLLLDRGGTMEAIEIRGDALYLGEIEDVADAALLGKPQRVSLADSRGNCATLVALLQSAREGRPIRL
ncbi:MAG: Gfo/Idh/MocA family oxidoreductase [Vicinamibacteria bacterium]|nr:Gfo/Idh/MocA family oxidoreductase [Vicinamibacteria bacterium]